MARTEEGEFEFVVGNKHLLSAVFVLMVLFGIFFSLGYFVGRSGDSGSAAPPQTAASAPASGVRQPQEAPPASAPDTQMNPGEAQVSQPPEGTQPVAAAPTSAEAKPEPPPAPEPEPARTASAGPQPGQTFLQVAAVKQSEAKVIVDVLRGKGFNAVTAPVVVNGVVSDSLFRALVGPVKDAAELARLKSDLQAAGFKPYVQKY